MGWNTLLLMEEILHQLICSFSHYLQGFIHPRWRRISSINSRMWLSKDETSQDVIVTGCWWFFPNTFTDLPQNTPSCNTFVSKTPISKASLHILWISLQSMKNKIYKMGPNPNGPRSKLLGSTRYSGLGVCSVDGEIQNCKCHCNSFIRSVILADSHYTLTLCQQSQSNWHGNKYPRVP